MTYFKAIPFIVALGLFSTGCDLFEVNNETGKVELKKQPTVEIPVEPFPSPDVEIPKVRRSDLFGPIQEIPSEHGNTIESVKKYPTNDFTKAPKPRTINELCRGLKPAACKLHIKRAQERGEL